MPKLRPSGPRQGSMGSTAHWPFDPVLAERCFTGRKDVRITKQDDIIKQCLLERHDMLLPSQRELSQITQLVTGIQATLDGLIIASDIDGCELCEVRQVGSLRKQLLLKGECKAELVVVLKTCPTFDSIQKLGEYVIKKQSIVDGNERSLAFQSTENGFNIVETGPGNKEIKVIVYATTITSNFRRLLSDLHLSLDACRLAQNLLFECRWFEESGFNHSNVKVLIRIVLDLRQRYDDLKPLSNSTIEKLVHYSVLNVHQPSQRPLHLGRAFTRLLQLLASGHLTSGSFGLKDTTNESNKLTLRDQERICCGAQTLLNVLLLGGARHVLGLVNDSKRLLMEKTVWDGVVVTPLGRVLEEKIDTEPPDDVQDKGPKRQ